MKKIIVLCAACAALHGSAAENKAVQPSDTNAQARTEARLKMTGGMIINRDSFKGLITIVDAQKECPEKELRALAKDLLAMTEYHVEYVRGSDELARKSVLQLGPAAIKETGANISVVVTSSDDLPPSLIAIEKRWAVVNVKALKGNLPKGKVGDVLFAARCRKETMRAFSVVCGGSGSQYQGTIVNAISPEDLDTLDETIPLDTIMAYNKYLARLGVTRRRMVTYRRAYIEGWAPAPTNDYQRACIEGAKEARQNYLTRKAEKDQKEKK